MLKIDLTSKAGGVRVNWRTGEGLSLHRLDGSLILKINAPYADDRALSTAAHALNFMFRSIKHAGATNTGIDLGDGGQA